MKKLSIRILFFLAVLSVIGSSCKKDYLETAPTGSIAKEDAFKTTANAWAALNGMHRLMYRQFYGTQSLGGQSGNMIFMDVLGEDMVMTHAALNWFISEYKWISHRSPTSTINYYDYLFYFTFVSNANEIIANIDKADGPDQDKKTIKGQAYTYRAWAYFQMVQLFGERFVKGSPNSSLGVPEVLAPAMGPVPRATVAENYVQINKDIDEAITLLTGAPARANVSHLNLNVAKGIKARIALATQEWATAAQFAKEARTGFSFMSQAQMYAGFNNIANPEWMWGIKQQEDQGTAFYSFFANVGANFNSTTNRLNPKAINSLLYDKITATDIRKGLWDPTGKDAVNFPIPPGGSRYPYMTRKFLVPNTNTSNGDLAFMRSAEMYLIEAEALARSGKDVEARAALFDLAKNRDKEYVLSVKSGADLIDEIMTQRRVELWGEGFRFYDLKRTATPLNRNGANHNASLTVVFDVPVNDIRWQFLIPQDEINNTNNVVVQNPL